MIVVVGPTGVGKSDLAVEIAKIVGGEIVSADSMQIYRMMDIGTAKMTPEEMQGIPHHLIDIVDPDQEFTVAEYVKYADRAIKAIRERGNTPIVAGGTGLYIKALLEDFLFPDQGADWEFRDEMKRIAEVEGNQFLHTRLAEVDPITASRLHPNDVRRVVRALEVYKRTGMPMSSQMASYGPARQRFKAFQVGLTCDRQLLYKRIDLRVDKMVAMGLVNEVKSLVDSGYGNAVISMQALGYKEIIWYLKGLTVYEESIELLKRETRRYSKRQLSWFRRDSSIIWYDRFDYSDLKELAQIVVDRYKAEYA